MNDVSGWGRRPAGGEPWVAEAALFAPEAGDKDIARMAPSYGEECALRILSWHGMYVNCTLISVILPVRYDRAALGGAAIAKHLIGGGGR